MKPLLKKNTAITKTKSNSSISTAYLILLFISSTFYNRSILDFTHIPRFAMLSGVFIIMILITIKIKQNYSAKFNLITISLPAYFLISLISISYALNKSEAVFESGKIFLGVLVFTYTDHFLKTENDFEIKLSRLVTLISLIFSGVALWQILGLKGFSFQNIYSINSISGHKNLLATLLFLSIPFSVNGLLNNDLKWKWMYILSLILTASLIFFLQTRSVWMATTVALVTFTFISALKFHSHYKKIIFRSAIIFVLTISSLFCLLHFNGKTKAAFARLNVLNYSQSETGKERLGLWKKTILLAEDYAPLGCGAGNWQLLYAKNGIDGIPSVVWDNHTFQRPHNDFLWVISETGIAGLFFYLLFLLGPLIYTLLILIKKNSAKATLRILLFASTLLGFIVISFFDFPKERTELILISTLLVAVLYHLISSEKPIRALISINIPGFIIIGISIVVLSINLFMSYHKMKGEYNMKKVYKYKSLQNWPAVIKYCNKASSPFYSIDPTSIPITWYKGLAYFSQGNNKPAFDNFLKAFEIAPYNPHILNNLGSAYEVLGKHGEAKKCYREALKINSWFDDPKLNLAAIYYNEKNYQEAYNWTLKANDTLSRKQEYLKIIEPLVKK